MASSAYTVPRPRRILSQDVQVGPLFKIHVVNYALTIATLGIYRFWAKTRIRRYLWNHLSVLDDRLEYTGTGKELLLGFLLVVGGILLPLLLIPELISLAIDAPPSAEPAFGGFQFLILYLLLPIAIFRARRYRLSRTAWRGIRGGQSGSALNYAWKVHLYNFLNVITLSLFTPVKVTRLAAYRLNNTWIGSQRLEFEGRSGELYPAYFGAIGLYLLIFILAILLAGGLIAVFGLGAAVVQATAQGTFDPEQLGEVITTGGSILTAAIGVIFIVGFQIPRLWFNATAIEIFTENTSFMGRTLRFDMHRWRYVWLVLSNQFLTVFTIGLALPLVYRRYLNFMTERFTVTGAIDTEALKQTSEEAPNLGEGLVDALDVGGFGA